MQIFMQKTNPDLNMDRYYAISTTVGLFGDHGVQRHWGRRGTRGHYRLDWYVSKKDAKTAANELANRKLSRGYSYLIDR